MNLVGVNVDWAEEFNGSVTVCDREGIIVYMNRYSVNQFKNYGGEKLLGTNLVDCHPEPSKTMLKRMLIEPFENMYTTEKEGKKTIIFQTPWMKKGEFAGVIELSFDLVADLPNYNR